MRIAQEEVYIAMVVVKRPSRPGQPELDPTEWAQSVLRNLNAEGVDHRACTIARGPALPFNGRIPPSPRPRRIESSRWLYLGLGIGCFTGAGYLLYLVVQ